MIVKELIDKLSKLNPELRVFGCAEVDGGGFEVETVVEEKNWTGEHGVTIAHEGYY